MIGETPVYRLLLLFIFLQVGKDEVKLVATFRVSSVDVGNVLHLSILCHLKIQAVA